MPPYKGHGTSDGMAQAIIEHVGKRGELVYQGSDCKASAPAPPHLPRTVS